MWVIKKVRVKNFRSIVYGEFEPGTVSLIVGENDVGKSNYLRALNLFFNNETDVGRSFSFSTDFSMSATVGVGKARQIEVALYIEPPSTFADRGLILWKRYWREESATHIAESFHRLPGRKEIPLKSKAIQWLRRIKFRYVPAIKGADYFTSLLRDLHDTLAETVDAQLRSAATDFIGVVRGHTTGISAHLAETISLQSRLELPANLRSLFEVLDFSTSNGNSSISLQLRGDGIKVRHIPAVLTFLADQERRLAPVGKPRPTAIWGYEEPENNLEMKRAFEHANELLAAREVAQIFITTHSPAFYGLASKEPDVWAFSANPHNDQGTQLTRVNAESVSQFDDGLGLMPLIAPYIAEKVQELTAIKGDFANVKERIAAAERPMIILAGETDVEYVSSALKRFSPETFSAVDVYCVGRKEIAGSVGTGDPRLVGLLEQWNHRPELLSKKVLVIFDGDAKRVPESKHPLVVVWQMPLNANNAIADRGIENLLPEVAFEQRFYRKRVEKLPYGGLKEVITLDKTLLCSAVCSPAGALYSKQDEMLGGLGVIVEEVNKFIKQG